MIVGFYKEHSETWTPENFIKFTIWSPNSSMVILIIFIPWTFLQYFFNEGGNIWTIGETGQLAEFFYGIFKIFHSRYPSQGYPSHANSRDKESLNSSTQAKPSQAWGAAWGAAQARCSSAALPSDYITTPVALVQHCSGQRSSTEEQWAAAAAGRLRSISLVCRLHNTITLHLTDVKSSPRQGQVKGNCQYTRSSQNQPFTSLTWKDSSSSQSFLSFYHGSPSLVLIKVLLWIGQMTQD